MARNNVQNANLASEFYIASQLFRLGYVATLTLGHTKEIDLIVAHEDRIITIDVKGLKNTTNWPIKLKLKRDNHFYVLVSYHNQFGNTDFHPEVFVIPSMEIEDLLTNWPNKSVTCIRYSKLKDSKYRNAWDLLSK